MEWGMKHTRTKRAVSSVVTSVETSNLEAVASVAALKTLDAKVMQKAIRAIMMLIMTLLKTDQFNGFSGSSGPFHATKLGSSATLVCCGV